MKHRIRWMALMLLGSSLLPAWAVDVVTPEALFADLGTPSRSYALDDGRGWRYSSAGRDVWDETKPDPEGGASFSVEFRRRHIGLALHQYLDDPEQAQHNQVMQQKMVQAVELLTGSNEIWPAVESGKIAGKSAGYVNGWTIVASPYLGDGQRYLSLSRK